MSEYKVPTWMIEKAAKIFSVTGQSIKTIEELGELTQAIAKHENFPTLENQLRVLEEIADVRNMLDQYQFNYGIHDDQVNIVRKEKLRRLENILNQNDTSELRKTV
ncbi:nucleoside triphosphate pyrophosphohydrolase family protein [Leptospira kirschneri]|uniref:hypothetical protein n=1 Tax=Leptospira kirschneri TaxID=29507 RepID=UPI001F536B37|nr:hypothetical protein [Leptospira kirschneri]UML78914.1 hypothetical protein FH602_02145 [Leptospira kirschneri]